MGIANKLRAWRKPKQLDLEDYLAKLKRYNLNEDGTVIIDPVPIAPPIGYKRQPSMVEIVREAVRSEHLARAAAAAGYETLEEAEDFDVGDPTDLPGSPWENDHDPSIEELIKAGKEAVAQRAAAEAAEAAKKAAKKGGVRGAPPPAAGGDEPPEAP